MKNIKKSLFAATGLLLCNPLGLSSASAAVVLTNSTQGTPYAVLTGDLLEATGTTHLNTIAGTATVITDTDQRFMFSDGSDTGAFIGVPSVANGSFGAMPTGPKNRAEFIGVQNQAGLPEITYSFDLSGANATGYNIGTIDIYSAWNNNGRDAINLTISYALVSTPTTFVNLQTVSYNPTVAGSTPVANRSSVTDSTGTLVSGVSSLRFTFTGQENNGVGYREIDVTVVPEPSTWAMLLGGAGLMFVIQRRRSQRAA